MITFLFGSAVSAAVKDRFEYHTLEDLVTIEAKIRKARRDILLIQEELNVIKENIERELPTPNVAPIIPSDE